MLRFLTPVLWAFVTLVFGLDAVAQPCDLRVNLQTEMQHDTKAEMPCHDSMMAVAETQHPDAPQNQEHQDHQNDTCCCAALLTNAVTFDRTNVAHPLPGLSLWAMPLPVTALSVSIEDEPPPPRA